MSKLKLDIPKVKYPENCFPILADHPDMMYWLTKDNMFCKTIKHFQKKHNINALNNEIRIMEYLKNKEKSIEIIIINFLLFSEKNLKSLESRNNAGYIHNIGKIGIKNLMSFVDIKLIVK